ncbi:hypothetical protein ACMAZE_12360 [Pseudopelagicola sp. nBUS_20]|uniref:hypothetical protein n=1 Tax=Pseudopelagicola sp. nBUS_20 TaxID=3395317 RepID=UPI003EC0450C
MQIVLHIGAHFTNEEKLINSLGKNTELLEAQGVSIAPLTFYNQKIRSFVNHPDEKLTPLGIRKELLADLTQEKSPDRVVMSNTKIFGIPKLAVRNNLIYPNAGTRLETFAKIFHSEDIEVFFAIRNPATFLPALMNGTPVRTVDELTDGSLALSLRWSELIMRVRNILPNVPVTVWCNEDTPLIWEAILRELAGFDPTVPILGGLDLLEDIMSSQGLSRFKDYLNEHPGMSEIQKRRVIAAFLEKFGLEDELEEELDLQGWTEELVHSLTEAYDEDVFLIERIPGVTLITP